jgi:hypothetical protein
MALRKADMTTNEPVSNIVRRPGSVTLVLVLTIISGILTLLVGSSCSSSAARPPSTA